MYIKRHTEKTVEQLSRMFGAVLVAGTRQVGKTTMLDRLTGDINKVILDDPIVRASAEEESGTLYPIEMKNTPTPQRRILMLFHFWIRFQI